MHRDYFQTTLLPKLQERNVEILLIECHVIVVTFLHAVFLGGLET